MKFLQHVLLALGLALFGVQTVAADTLSAQEAAFAFGGAPNGAVHSQQIAPLSDTEMVDTEGQVAPIVVYGLQVGGRIAYVGITNNLPRRIAQHATTKTFSGYVRLGGTHQTRTGARIAEQNLINKHNTINNGMNRINSISPRNPLSGKVNQPYR